MEGDLYNILKDYLQNRKQGVVINGKYSSWLDINVGVPEGSVLGPLLFIIYINDLPENVVSLSKSFAYATSILSTIFDIIKSIEDLNRDLKPNGNFNAKSF